MSRSTAGYERLPMSFRDGTSSSSSSSSRFSIPFIRSPARLLLPLIKYGIPLTLACIALFLFFIEPKIEIFFYSREWIKAEIEPTPPLAGCFQPENLSSTYNATLALFGGRQRNEVQAGMPLRLGLDCYDFAGTVNLPAGESLPRLHGERTQFHTYWRVDLAPFGPRQEYTLKSFFATQNVDHSRLILWSNGDLSGNMILQKYLRRYPEAFSLKVVDIPTLAKGTALDGSELLKVNDKKAWVDGDLVRLLVIWVYGGVWVDMDSLLTRSLEPLLEHEFVTQWDCFDKLYQPFNGALMHFHKQSPYLCEAFHVMATSPPPKSDSTDWGALLYLKLWRRLVAASVPPFKVLPFCFSDGRSCRLDNRLPDPFVKDGKGRGAWTTTESLKVGGGLDRTLGKVFAVHLHNQWEKAFPQDGWVRRLLLSRYEEKLDEL